MNVHALTVIQCGNGKSQERETNVRAMRGHFLSSVYYLLYKVVSIFQQPSIMRLDINLERMVIHRNILLQTSWGNILDAEIIGPWNDECCYTGVWGKYIR